MFKRVLAIMLILTFMLSLTACKSNDEEENASAGEIVEGVNDNNTNTPSDNNDDSTDTPADDTNTTPDDDDGDDNDTQTPPLSTSGNYSVTFDFGYDNKSETEKTDGKATEMDIQRAGYEFEGWYNGNDKWDFGTSVTEDITLTAKWKLLTYTITYKADGATLPSSNPTSYSVEDGSFELAAPTKKGGVFVGWAMDNGNGSTTNINGISKGMTGNLTLVAVWNENAIILGTYEQDGNEENGKEPIVWIKLKEENGKGYFVSEKILDGKQYQSPKKSVSWQTSTLRKWLNDGFYKTAFSAEDKELILQEDIHTPVNSQTGVGTAVNTKDHVILLSLEEAEELTSWQQRKAQVTAYAKSQGCIASNENTGDWWLRSSGCYDNYAALIQENSGIRENGYSVDLATIGVRPAIWVDMSKLG